MENPFRSGCAYSWVETWTPFNNPCTILVSDKYFHTLCTRMEVMVECLCLLSNFTMFDKSLEMLVFLL
jgi:hypothetical protein